MVVCLWWKLILSEAMDGQTQSWAQLIMHTINPTTRDKITHQWINIFFTTYAESTKYLPIRRRHHEHGNTWSSPLAHFSAPRVEFTPTMAGAKNGRAAAGATAKRMPQPPSAHVTPTRWCPPLSALPMSEGLCPSQASKYSSGQPRCLPWGQFVWTALYLFFFSRLSVCLSPSQRAVN